MNSRIFFKSLLITTLACTPLLADASHKNKHHHHHQQSYTTFARVTHVEPIVRYIEVNRPYEECWEEGYEDDHYDYESQREHKGRRSPLLQKSQNSGIAPQTKVTQPQKEKGNIISSTIGQKISQRQTKEQRHSQNQSHSRGHGGRQECRVVHRSHREKRIDGYLVHYRYKGENFETRLPYDPGDRMEVRVSVTPTRR